MASDEEDGNGEAMLPVIPEELGADPLVLALLQCAAFLDFADEQLVDPEAATEVLDHLAYYVRRLPTERLDAMQADLERVEEHGAREGWSGQQVEFVADFLTNCTADDVEDDEPADQN
jgi:hypothetical protein